MLFLRLMPHLTTQTCSSLSERLCDEFWPLFAGRASQSLRRAGEKGRCSHRFFLWKKFWCFFIIAKQFCANSTPTDLCRGWLPNGKWVISSHELNRVFMHWSKTRKSVMATFHWSYVIELWERWMQPLKYKSSDKQFEGFWVTVIWSWLALLNQNLQVLLHSVGLTHTCHLVWGRTCVLNSIFFYYVCLLKAKLQENKHISNSTH